MKTKKTFIIIFSFIFLCINNVCFAINDESLYAESAMLIDSNTGIILYEKNSDQRMYPASTTKIMTAILAIENCDLDDVITINYNAISSIPSGYSIAELTTDEELTVKQLLEVLLIHSANDAANVLGMHVGGSLDSFISMMNSKANEIGCTNTHFTNTYGLHDESHYTTARDLALLAKYCMQNSTFRHFVSQPKCQIAPTNNHSARTYNNTNDLIRTTSKYYYPYAIGIKTGYTKEAGNCLISASKKDNFEIISVVLNTGAVAGRRCEDSIELFNYAYNNFAIKSLAQKNDIITQINVKNGTKETKNLDVILSKDIKALIMLSENQNEITPTINLNPNISAPLAAGSKIGTISYTVLDKEYTADLLASHDVKKSELVIKTLKISLVVILLVGLLIFILKIIRKHRNKF